MVSGGVDEGSQSSHPRGNSPSADARLRHEYGSTDEGARRIQPTAYWRSAGKPVISIAMIDEHSFTRECITRSLQQLDDDLNITSFATREDCLKSAGNYDLVLYHFHESMANREFNDEQLGFLAKILAIGPLIMLVAHDAPGSAFKALESGARGYVPTASTSLELAVEIIRLVRAGGTFVPPSSLPARGVSLLGTTRGATTSQQFTERQLAVLGHLKQGKTNKIIAHELKMSESTVKVHIRKIMKKLNATNRTEVACRAHELEISAPRPTD
jgi:DNA-binding NarL/FixJ family response regulator